MIERRDFLKALAALACAAPATAQPHARPRFDADPFSLGVASGYPLADSVTLWTRLAPHPEIPDGGLGPQRFEVRWDVANDESMRHIVASGTEVAGPEWGHSVHAEARGLEAARSYWYRFTAGDAHSAVGRTRTAPAGEVERLRFAFASCQHFEQGWFTAYRHMLADDPGLIVFLGDYIYESSWGRERVRRHNAPEPYTLDDYRVRHALYKGDPHLQAAHRACPWILTWDDHEVDNDYADDRPEDGMDRESFLKRRAAAYQAYYEHLPLPAHMRPRGADMRIYTEFAWGRDLRFFLLDDRQYRSWHACPRPGRRGGSNTVDVEVCESLANPNRSMLGRVQERWLEAALARSPARWNILAQQTPMAQFDQKPGPGRIAWTDGWDGYPAARKRLLDFIAAQRIANPVVIGGDVHSFNVNDLKADFDDPASPVVASEFVATSITSQAWAQERLDRFLPDNPHMKLVDSRYRGYVRVDVAPRVLRADLRAMDNVQQPDAACSTLSSWVVEDGRAGAQRA